MKRFVGMVVLLILCCTLVLNCRAEGIAPVDPAAEAFLSRVGLRSWTDDGKARLIQCFDVSGKGEIALGFSGAVEDTKYIGVYDSAGDFLYGYTFRCTGSYQVEWVGEGELAIWWIRGSLRATFDRDGTCREYLPYEMDKAWNRRLNDLHRAERVIGDERFCLDKGDGFLSQLAMGYGRLIRVAADGSEHVIYSAAVDTRLSGLLVVAFIGFVAFTGIYSFVRARKTHI